MAFSINDITSAISALGGLAKPSHFYVSITPPASLIGNEYSRQASFFCDAASLPGLSYGTQNVKTPGYGTTEKRPLSADFNDVQLSFMIDAKGSVIEFFTKWMALINNWSRIGVGVANSSGLDYGEWSWPEEYEGTVDIHFMTPDSKDITVYTLVHAFPVQMGDVGVGWEQNDSLARLPIVMAYNTWNTKSVPNSTVPQTSQSQSNLPKIDQRLAPGYNKDNF